MQGLSEEEINKFMKDYVVYEEVHKEFGGLLPWEYLAQFAKLDSEEERRKVIKNTSTADFFYIIKYHLDLSKEPIEYEGNRLSEEINKLKQRHIELYGENKTLFGVVDKLFEYHGEQAPGFDEFCLMTTREFKEILENPKTKEMIVNVINTLSERI